MADLAQNHYSDSVPNPVISTSKELLKQMSMGDILQSNCQVISNKVAPVVIRNCKEEFQMRAEMKVAVGKLHDHLTEHDLLMNKYFLLKDHFVGIDRYGSLQSSGVPNLRKCTDSPAVFAIGQPTLNGVKKFIKDTASAYTNILYINVRAVPTLFLRRSGDFLPYSAYNKSSSVDDVFVNERELNEAEKEIQIQAMGIASRNDNMFYFYNALDAAADEPHMYSIKNLSDLVTSRQLNAKIQSETPNFRYKRLPLFDIQHPSVEWVDSLIQEIKESDVLFDNKSAVIFQGLTGEGPASIAMMIAGLFSIQIHAEVKINRKNLKSMQLIETTTYWKNYVLNAILKNNSSTYHSEVREKVDTIIASALHESLLLRFARQVRHNALHNNGLDWLLKETTHVSNDIDVVNGKNLMENITSQYSIESEDSDVLDVTKLASLSLRDVSELSLPQGHNRSIASKSMSILHHGRSVDDSLNGECDTLSESPSTATASMCSIEQKGLFRYEVFEEEEMFEKLFLIPDLYMFLIIFSEYLNCQMHKKMQFTFSKWLTFNPNYLMHLSQIRHCGVDVLVNQGIMCLKATEDDLEGNRFSRNHHRVVGFPVYGVGHLLPQDYAEGVRYICRSGARKKYDRVVYVNLKNEIYLYTDSLSVEEENNGNVLNVDGEQSKSKNLTNEIADDCNKREILWKAREGVFPSLYGAQASVVEDVEERVCYAVNNHPSSVSLLNYDHANSYPSTHGSFQTTKQVVCNILNTRESLQSCCKEVKYVRMSMPKYRIPHLAEFDRLVRLIRDEHKKDQATAFVFFCHNGKRRSTNMMAAACLVLGHLMGFPDTIKESLEHQSQPWVPDAEYTRGEFKVVLDILQIIPESYKRKLEVDAILDLCYETMSTMHYHLRESLSPAHKKAARATFLEDKIKYTQRSVQSLEFYIYLILFDAYLENNKSNLWEEISFEQWMREYASRLGAMDILNDLGYHEFGDDRPFTKAHWRWLSSETVKMQIFSTRQPSRTSIFRKKHKH